MPILRIPSLLFHAGNAIGVNRRHSRWLSSVLAPLSIAVLSAILLAACSGSFSRAADDATVADTALPKPVAAPSATAATAFQPEDISIGEPISLPRATPLASPAPGRPPSPPPTAPAGGPFQTTPAQLPSVIVPATPPSAVQPAQVPAQVPADPGASLQPAAAGSGWLGIAVDETVVTGRLVVVEVAPDGPAAKAGVRPQDMLLAINGNQLHNGDEMAAALAAIAPGQQVKMAVGRDNRVEDVVAQAAARPPEALSRDWQSAIAGPAAAVAPSASMPASAAPPPALVAPTHLVPEPATISVLPPPAALLPARAVTDPPQLARPATATPAASGRTALGVRTVPVDPNVQSRFQLSEAQGAFVIGVVQDLPASKAGVPPGSVIVAINHQPVRSPQDLTQLVARGPVGTPVPLQYVLPGGQSKQAEVVLQSLQQPLERALIGDGDAGQTAEPPSLQPAPLTTRRVQATAGYQSAEPATLVRLEELLLRMNNRLEQLERRLERIESGR
jgi:membrane-associated protease RseP (regulator of RpoE activity)